MTQLTPKTSPEPKLDQLPQTPPSPNKAEVPKKGKPRPGAWDTHFEKWIHEAEASGLDPNDIGDIAWANDYLATVLRSRYLRYVSKGAAVLELGPGSGRLTRHLVGLAARVELIDNSQFVVDWMTRYLAGKIEARSVLIDAPLMPHIVNDSINVVLSHGVFEHLDFDETYFFLAEFKRVLKSGGVVSFNYNTLHNADGAQWFLDHRRRPGDRCIFRFYTPDLMERIADLAGFKTLESITDDRRLAHLVLEKP